MADPVCECTVAGGHSAGKLGGPAAGAVQPVHRLQPSGPLCAHSSLGPKSFRSVMVHVLSLWLDTCQLFMSPASLVPFCTSLFPPPGLVVGFLSEKHLEQGTHPVFSSG